MHRPKFTLKEKIQYRFDNLMSTGTFGLILALSAITVIMLFAIAVFALLIPDTRQQGLSLSELLWMGLMRTLDPGTMGSDRGSWLFLLAMLAFTIAGIFVVGSLISILTTGLDRQIERLRKGRSRVLEKNHTIILGWTPKIFTVLSELNTANENQSSAAVAIMAEKDKVQMEDEIYERLGRLPHLKIVCRTGSPIDPKDLEILNPTACKSIIILTPEGTSTPDAHVIKSILALVGQNAIHAQPYQIVAEIRNSANLEVANMIGGRQVELIHTDELLVRLTAQTCLQSGLSVIYTELMDFDGDEIYFSPEPGLTGLSFGQALLAYEDSAVIGMRFTDGTIKLNPPMETVFQPGDQVIAISEDDDTVRLSSRKQILIDEQAIRLRSPLQQQPEYIVLLAWNHRARGIIKELDTYVAPGSQLLVVANLPEAEQAVEELKLNLINQQIQYRPGDTTDRPLLNSLDFRHCKHIILLGYSDLLPPQESDAHTLVTLLHLRDISLDSGYPFTIVSEMMDTRNRELAELARPDDFIVSDKLISLTLTQISENKEVAKVFQDLFDPQGSEIYLKPVEDYVKLGKPINFYTVIAACQQRQETAVGYRLTKQANDPESNHGIHLNPEKSKFITFSSGDRIIVLSES